MGFDAPTSRSARGRLAHLWQGPLLLFSLILFAYAGYLFVNPGYGPTLVQRVDVARKLLAHERPDAAREWLNGVLEEHEKLKPELEGAIRMLLGQSIEQSQKQRHISVAENHARIIQQTKQAMALGIAADADVHRRLAESYEALGRAVDAVGEYRLAIAGDPSSALKWQRKIIDLQLSTEDLTAAADSLEQFLRTPDLARSERAWALGERAHILIDRGQFKEARELLAQAIALNVDEPAELGQFNYWLGYCAWKLNDNAQAEMHLRVARDQLRVSHPLDADAGYLLGRIRQSAEDYPGAISFYMSVLQSHLDSKVAPAAKLQRGVCRISLNEHEAGLSDLSDVVRQVQEKLSLPARLREETVAALKASCDLLTRAAHYQGALEVLNYEQQLVGKPSAEFFQRLAGVYERRAGQVLVFAEDIADQDRDKRIEQSRNLKTKAGEAYLAYSRALTLRDDKGYGQAMWRGIELFDAAGEIPRTISALETFIAERPEDPITPDALLKLGQSYQAAGLFDKAIETYKRNQLHYPKSLAASKSGVPLARAYVAKGPEFYKKAEQVLNALVDDNPQITPEAAEFRESLLELSNLFYRTGRFELAIARLEELMQRYPEDDRRGQMLFVMADSYRKSGQALEDQIARTPSAATTQPAFDLAEATRARTDRLTRARDLFADAIEFYRARAAAGELNRLYLKLSYFYRADCTFDLGEFAESIKMYGDAAFRYQDDPLALAAYVQIVNANVSLGKTEEAKAANERAKWMLRRMPAEAFTDTSLGMQRRYWEEWLKWSGEVGMWK